MGIAQFLGATCLGCSPKVYAYNPEEHHILLVQIGHTIAHFMIDQWPYR